MKDLMARAWKWIVDKIRGRKKVRLSVDDATHGISVDTIGLGQPPTLRVQSARHATRSAHVATDHSEPPIIAKVERIKFSVR